MQQKKHLSDPSSQLSHRRYFRTTNTFVALFVVILIISAAVLLFTNRSQSQGGLLGKLHTILMIFSVQNDRLQMSVTITPGPYFLSEMLGIDLLLVNRTQNTVYIGSPFTKSACGYFSGITISGGNAPNYQLPIPLGHSCPPFSDGVALPPGKSITAHTYESLASSGLLTLTGQTSFYTRSANDSGGEALFQSSDPLRGHWPTVKIQVSPTIPADRQLSLKQDGEHVNFDGPQEVRSDLVYAYGLECGSIATGDMTGTGSYFWNKLAQPKASVTPPQDDYCAGKKITWTYVFAAPGYAVASGVFHS